MTLRGGLLSAVAAFLIAATFTSAVHAKKFWVRLSAGDEVTVDQWGGFTMKARCAEDNFTNLFIQIAVTSDLEEWWFRGQSFSSGQEGTQNLTGAAAPVPVAVNVSTPSAISASTTLGIDRAAIGGVRVFGSDCFLAGDTVRLQRK